MEKEKVDALAALINAEHDAKMKRIEEELKARAKPKDQATVDAEAAKWTAYDKKMTRKWDAVKESAYDPNPKPLPVPQSAENGPLYDPETDFAGFDTGPRRGTKQKARIRTVKPLGPPRKKTKKEGFVAKRLRELKEQRRAKERELLSKDPPGFGTEDPHPSPAELTGNEIDRNAFENAAPPVDTTVAAMRIY